MSMDCCTRFQHMNLFGKAVWGIFLLLITSVVWYFGLPLLLPGNLGYVLVWFTPYLLGGLLFGLLLFGLALGVVKMSEWWNR